MPHRQKVGAVICMPLCTVIISCCCVFKHYLRPISFWRKERSMQEIRRRNGSMIDVFVHWHPAYRLQLSAAGSII
jgi:hypothetical protein